MIFTKTWRKRKDTWTLYHYYGVFLLGIIPLYIRRTIEYKV